uniref:Uncharacterized protein n=1 Tax=Ditylenchus dipsaci TaxID=166011 RepID=A0A915E7I5_9BILA
MGREVLLKTSLNLMVFLLQEIAALRLQVQQLMQTQMQRQMQQQQMQITTLRAGFRQYWDTIIKTILTIRFHIESAYFELLQNVCQASSTSLLV